LEESIDEVADSASINFVIFCWAKRVVIARVESGSAAFASLEIAGEEATGTPPDGAVGWDAGTPDQA